MAYVRNKTVRVVITQKPGGAGYNFALNSNNGQGPVQNVGFDNNNHPGVVVYFNIDDQANSGLTFQPNPRDAVWSAQPGDPNWPPPPACPANPSHWEQFVPLSVEKDNNGDHVQLIVYFRNLDPNVQFFFALRFRRPDGRGGWEEINYDPIGDGNNGLRA